MSSPFPGLDPFIEAAGRWEDSHNKLIGDMERHLSESLPPRYTVRIGERSYIDFIDPRSEAGSEGMFKPDVGIKTTHSSAVAVSAGATVLPEGAVEMEALVEEEVRELFLEIHEIDPAQRLVTVIELLSPSNKRPNALGWHQYQRKRKVFLDGHANLVEMDLLRGGRRMAMSGTWPANPYYIMVLRKESAPRCQVFPAHFREPLPVVPIPLAPPDPDFPLQLQDLVVGVHNRSRYGREIDYAGTLRPPLSAGDSDWLAERLEQWQAGVG